MKIKEYIVLILVLVLSFTSCNNDDGNNDSTTVEARDRNEQYLVDLDSIETYLETHFYNYEDFEVDPNSKIVFDTIAGDNAHKIPLMDQVVFKTVKELDTVVDLEYKLYYLKVREGLGEQPTYADSAYVTYKGNTIYNSTVFDSRVTPEWLVLPNLVQGFREVVSEFKGASNFYIDPDTGTQVFEDYGIGAMFIPSGLGYYENYQTNIPSYSPLIFTFELYNANDSDSDADGVPNILEDINGNRYLYDDDTDEDGVPDFLDIDDDGDTILTIYEDLNEDGDPTNDDDNGDGIPNYLDKDATASTQDS